MHGNPSLTGERCHEGVTRKGEYQPCDKPAVGLRPDLEGGPYPVCRKHLSDAVPKCPEHREVQHRDGKRPWCNTCGWTHGRPAAPPAKLGEPRNAHPLDRLDA